MSKLTIRSKMPGSYSPMALEVLVDGVRIKGVQSLKLEIGDKKIPTAAITFVPKEIEVDHKALIDFVVRLKDQSTPEQVEDIEKGKPVTYDESQIKGTGNDNQYGDEDKGPFIKED